MHRAALLRLDASLSIGLGEYRDVIVVRGWSPREPEVIEEKCYAPGVGKISEILTSGGDDGTELVELTTPR